LSSVLLSSGKDISDRPTQEPQPRSKDINARTAQKFRWAACERSGAQLERL